MENKSRILYINKILEEETDENNTLTTNEIIESLKSKYNISVHRATLVKDIALLQEFGIDIITTRGVQSKYYIGNRRFELPELKILIDAVESSKAVTSKKTLSLIGKLHTLTSKWQISKLKRNNYVTSKPDNEYIYYIIDSANDAINDKKQISFQYYEYSGLKKKTLRNKGEVYTISPYYLIWSGDFYYLLGYSEKKQKIVTFRVDRIADIPKILDTKSIPMSKNFNLNEFCKSVFYMYDGDKIMVDLRCDNSLMKTMIDKFSEEINVLAYDMTSFRLLVDVSISPTFYGWLFGFGDKIEILAPTTVKSEYKRLIKEAYERVKTE